MFAGLIVGAVLAAAGGIAGLLFSRLLAAISGQQVSEKPFTTIGAAIGIALIKPAVAYINKPSAKEVMASIDQKFPFMADMKVRAPQTYKLFEQEVENAVEQDDVAAAFPKIRNLTAKIYDQRMPYMSDHDIIAFVRHVAEQADYLSSNAPDKCVQLMRGGMVDISMIQPQDMTEREGRILVDIASDTNKKPLPIANRAQMDAFFIKALPEIALQLGLPDKSIANALNQKAPADVECRVYAQLMHELANEPEKTQGPLARGIMLQK